MIASRAFAGGEELGLLHHDRQQARHQQIGALREGRMHFPLQRFELPRLGRQAPRPTGQLRDQFALEAADHFLDRPNGGRIRTRHFDGSQDSHLRVR